MFCVKLQPLNKGTEFLPQTPIFFATECLRNYVRLNKLSLKYQRFTPSINKDVRNMD